MYKFYHKIWIQPSCGIAKLLLIMKFTTLLLIVAIMQVSASGFAQKITLSKKNRPLIEVLNQIREQSGYGFIFNSSTLKDAKYVSIEVRNEELETVLKQIFKGQPLNYAIEDRSVVVSRKDNVPVPKADAIQQDISGKVSDKSGQPLVGATVQNPRSGQSVITDKKGMYTIRAQKGDFLIITFIGYTYREIIVREDKVINIILESSVENLDPVVVLGYTSRKASELTGGVQTIKGDVLRNGVSGLNTMAMLKGIATGLYIVEQGGSVANRGQVVMRGQSSFNDESNTNYGPLIVIDGFVSNAANLQDIIDPGDIESINILKDAASTAIYGSRAAQGVIMIVTKRGKEGKTKVNLNLNYGEVQNKRAIRFMNTNEAVAHIRKYMQTEYEQTPSLRALYSSFDQYYNTTRTFTDADLATSTKWDNDAFFSNGKQSDLNLSLSGGSDKTKIYTAIKWSKQDGTLLDDRVDRKAIRLNVDQKISDKLSFSLNSNVLFDKYTSSTSENQYYLFQPWVSPNYTNGSLADSIPNYSYLSTGSRLTKYYDNPLYSHSYNTAITNRLNLIGTGTLKYQVLPWLSVQSSNTINYTDNSRNAYKDPRTFRGRYDGSSSNPVYINGSLNLNQMKSSYFLSSNLINFNKSFGEHYLSAVVGQEYGRTHVENLLVSAYNTPYPGERNLGAFLNYGEWINKLYGFPANPSTVRPVDKASFSLFSQINESYKSRYFASASVRRDASTNFGVNNRFGTFYSLSAGWLVSQENFMKNIKAVNNLKLRASYGTSGREAGADYLNFSTYSDYVYYNSFNTVGSKITQLGNDNITWETTYTTNIGLDIGVWNRINLSLDLYNRDSKNLLQSVVLPSYVGFATQYRNVGAIRNKGLDIQLSTENIKSKDFSWTMNFNISFNKNRITAIKGDSLMDGGTRAYYRYVGDDINSLKAIKYAGVNPDNGRPLFERVLPNGNIELVDSIGLVKRDGLAGFQDMGSATPKFLGGWGNNFRYKNFNLSMLFNFSYGNKIVNTAVANFFNPAGWKSGFNLPQPNDAVRFWQGPGDAKANYPNFYDLSFDQRGAFNSNSSLLYVDASYIRLRNIRLSYDLPAGLLKKMKMASMNVYVSSDNVFVIKSKNLYAADPEGAIIGGIYNNYGGTGIASAMPRRFVIGLSAGF